MHVLVHLRFSFRSHFLFKFIVINIFGYIKFKRWQYLSEPKYYNVLFSEINRKKSDLKDLSGKFRLFKVLSSDLFFVAKLFRMWTSFLFCITWINSHKHKKQICCFMLIIMIDFFLETNALLNKKKDYSFQPKLFTFFLSIVIISDTKHYWNKSLKVYALFILNKNSVYANYFNRKPLNLWLPV